MLRDEMRRLRNSFSELSELHKLAYALLIFCGLILVGAAIFIAPILNTTVKLWIFAVVLLIVIAMVVCIYWTTRGKDSISEAIEPPATTDEIRQIPPQPNHAPTITAERYYTEDLQEEDFEIPQTTDIGRVRDNPSLYRHNFSLIPVFLKITLVVMGWIFLLYASISSNISQLWVVFGIATILAPLYCYYIALRWNGEEFIVNNEWYERPLTMPAPFTSSTPAIRRSEIGKYFIRQTVLDKICKTCRLYSDTPSPDDKQFHNVKWLTHPTELRRATGISAPRKNSYLSPFRKRNQ